MRVCRSAWRRRPIGLAGIAVLASLLLTAAARAETAEEWVQLGTRVHGFFGGFIPVGIRIGLDARERLRAEPRSLSILYYQGEKAPCPCVLDGVMLALQASPGQGTARISPDKAPPGLMAVIVIRERKSGGAGLRYAIADEWLPKILAWNKEEPLKRYEAAMAAQGVFTVESYADQ
jgi:formylmethanofuran dehydrogenase subunit E